MPGKIDQLPVLDFFARFNELTRRNPDRLAFRNITRNQVEDFTYSQVDREVRCISRYLENQGVGPGTPVGLLIENHPRWGMAFLAAQSAGAVIVPLDILHSPSTLAKLIAHSQCRFLIVSAKNLPALEQIQTLLPAPLPVLAIGASPGTFPDWDEAIASNVPIETLPLVEKALDEPYLILYTSGTTGDPKGVVLTRRNVFRNVDAALAQIRVTSEDHFLNVLPLYHVLALIINLIVPLYCGARTTFLDALDAQTILRVFREEGVTIFVCVPQFYYLLHRKVLAEIEKASGMKRRLFRWLLRLSRFSWKSLHWRVGRSFFGPLHKQFGPQFRIFGVGGARFDRSVAEQLTDLGFNLLQAYGMTETAALITVTPTHPVGVGSVGRPLPHCELRILNPDEHGIGEVLARGENIMLGYYKNPTATQETIDGDGWLHTGDLGYQDEQGFVYITGRAKDVIVLSSGKNIYPEEVEYFYQSNCNLIKEIAVVGREDQGGEGEYLHAVVVPDFDELRRQQVVNAYQMIRYLMESLSQQLPPHKRVKSLEIWQEALPRTTTRKLRRHEIQARLASGEAQPAQRASKPWAPDGEIETRLVALLNQVKPVPALHPDMNLELDVGLDSLERVELISSVQGAFQLSLSDEDVSRVFTFGELISLVKAREASWSESEIGKKSWSDLLDEPIDSEAARKSLPLLKRRPLVEPIVLLVAWTVRIVGFLLFRLRGVDVKNLPTDYPFMLCPNHLSFLDAFIVVGVLPNRVVRRFFSLGYSDYFEGGLTSFLGSLVRTLPVNADRNLRLTLRLAAEGLRRNLVLIVFPEGERSIDGTLKEFRKGPAILATKVGVPVVPVGIKGSYEVWSRGSNRFRLHPIQIRFGKPLNPEPSESVDAFNERLRTSVGELLVD